MNERIINYIAYTNYINFSKIDNLAYLKETTLFHTILFNQNSHSQAGPKKFSASPVEFLKVLQDFLQESAKSQSQNKSYETFHQELVKLAKQTKVFDHLPAKHSPSAQIADNIRTKERHLDQVHQELEEKRHQLQERNRQLQEKNKQLKDELDLLTNLNSQKIQPLSKTNPSPAVPLQIAFSKQFPNVKVISHQLSKLKNNDFCYFYFSEEKEPIILFSIREITEYRFCEREKPVIKSIKEVSHKGKSALELVVDRGQGHSIFLDGTDSEGELKLNFDSEPQKLLSEPIEDQLLKAHFVPHAALDLSSDCYIRVTGDTKKTIFLAFCQEGKIVNFLTSFWHCHPHEDRKRRGKIKEIVEMDAQQVAINLEDGHLKHQIFFHERETSYCLYHTFFYNHNTPKYASSLKEFLEIQNKIRDQHLKAIQPCEIEEEEKNDFSKWLENHLGKKATK